MRVDEKPLIWLAGEVKSPPFSKGARLEAGYLLRALQYGELLAMPHSRPLPVIGARCHELRVRDGNSTWRIIYRIDQDAIIILDVFQKKTRKTPDKVIQACCRRIAEYDFCI